MSIPDLVNAIHSVAAVAEQVECSLDGLSCALMSVSKELDIRNFSALAYISETAAKSCEDGVVGTEFARLAVIELCSRLLKSLELDQPFNFAGADEALTALLFPPAPAIVTPLSDEKPERLNLRSTKEFEEPIPSDSGDGSEWEPCGCDDHQLLEEFLSEAIAHLENAERLLLVLEDQQGNPDAINGLFRAVHSVKGSTGVVTLPSLGRLTHLAESILVRVRDGEIELTGGVFEVFLIAIDFVKEQVNSISTCYQAKAPLQTPRPPAGLLQCLEKTCDTGSCPVEELQGLRNRIRGAEADVRTFSSNQSIDSLRIDSLRLEQLIDLIGELVITESVVQHEFGCSSLTNANAVAARLRKTVRDVQQLSLSLKMVPIGSVLTKMTRMVRDLSTRLGKPCQLVIEGGDTEVDKTLLEHIADPLVHLIRNSLDHGIESCTQERVDAGKPEIATIRIAAEHRGGHVLINVSDDGKGLNRKAILERAVERSIVSSTAELNEHQIDLLIFAPGFSTASQVSEISGRGVGMDVVRQNVERIRGNVSIRSSPGKGTTITLELPLTLSIIDGTIVRAGNQRFIVPTHSVLEQVPCSSLEYVQTGSRVMANYRDQFIPVRKLTDLVGASHSNELNDRSVCILVESGRLRAALIVDEIVQQQPIVIKPLGGIMDAFEAFAGGALLPTGDVAFVLDLNSICRSDASGEPHKSRLEEVL